MELVCSPRVVWGGLGIPTNESPSYVSNQVGYWFGPRDNPGHDWSSKVHHSGGYRFTQPNNPRCDRIGYGCHLKPQGNQLTLNISP